MFLNVLVDVLKQTGTYTTIFREMFLSNLVNVLWNFKWSSSTVAQISLDILGNILNCNALRDYGQCLWKLCKAFLGSVLKYSYTVSSFLTMKTVIQNPDLANSAFNEFLIISNENIGFLLKFYLRFGEEDHIFKLRSLFATFNSLRSVEFPMHAVVRNSNSKYLLTLQL